MKSRLVLGFLFLLALYRSGEPVVMDEVRRRQKVLAHEAGRWPSDIVALKADGPELGWNIGKGWSMGVCPNGDIDAIMHVIVHETAHSMVEEVDHGEDFEEARQDMRRLANTLGVYTDVHNEPLCGTTVTE